PMTSPGELVARAGEMHLGGRMVDVQTMSFIFEAVAWLAQVLLSGMLDLYPRLRMAIFESNSTWLPQLLEHWDRLFKLYANERPPPFGRPAWFPQGEELERWAEAEADPRAHGITKFDLAKLDPRLLMQALRPY